jgi:hypothetical protein
LESLLTSAVLTRDLLTATVTDDSITLAGGTNARATYFFGYDFANDRQILTSELSYRDARGIDRASFLTGPGTRKPERE